MTVPRPLTAAVPTVPGPIPSPPADRALADPTAAVLIVAVLMAAVLMAAVLMAAVLMAVGHSNLSVVFWSVRTAP